MPGSTPIFGFPYPDPSDLVANYPALGQQLAEDVEDAINARKILQIVRATDVTARATTSTSFVDVTGMSVTITPSSATSVILIVCSVMIGTVRGSANTGANLRITDASNNPISGAERIEPFIGDVLSFDAVLTFIAYATPASTSATTYKLQFSVNTNTITATVKNNVQTGQIYAIEVAA
jgi:hypothetical protein